MIPSAACYSQFSWRLDDLWFRDDSFTPTHGSLLASRLFLALGVPLKKDDQVFCVLQKLMALAPCLFFALGGWPGILKAPFLPLASSLYWASL